MAPVFLGITFMISLPEAISSSFPQPVKWLEFSGSFLFLLFLKSKLSYDSHWSLTHSLALTHSLIHSFTHSVTHSVTHSLTHSLCRYIVWTAAATALGWFVWGTHSQVDDMTLQAFASGIFVISIISMEGLSIMDWTPVLMKPIIDHAVELLRGGDGTVWWHLLWLAIGCLLSGLIHFTSKYEQDSPVHLYGRLVIFATADAYCALRACQCLQRQASAREMYEAAEEYVNRVMRAFKIKIT